LEFLSHRLANGLEIVAECNGAVHSTALGFFVKTGSRDETDDVWGVSHFLEHMVFKGTPKRSAEDVNREFDEMGAHYNAYTSEEATVYYAAVLPEYQDWAVELIADILRPSLRGDDFETERQVIIEEIRMYQDQPPFGADDKCRAAYFGAHPLARTVLGTLESITHISVDAMRGYFSHRYSPGNIVLAGAGRVDFARLVASAERCCGAWPAMTVNRITAPVTARSGFQAIERASSAQEYAIQMARGPTAIDPDRYAAKVLATIVGDDSGSRLYWELVDRGYAEHANLGHYDYQDAGLYVTFMSCAPERAEENLQRVLDLFRRVETEGVATEEVETAKSKTNSRIVLAGERPRGRLFAVGSNWIQRGGYRSTKDDLDTIAAITVNDVHAVLKRYPLSATTTVATGPLAEVAPPV